VLGGDREGPQAPEWFAFGRDLLVAAAQSAIVAAATAEADTTRGASPDVSLPSTTPHIDLESRAAFVSSLSSASPFATIVANAALSLPEAEVLAVLATAEADRHCQQLVASIQGDANSGRLTLGTLGDIFERGHLGALALGPESRLRCAALADVAVKGPWAGHVIELHRGVVWALIGDLSPDPGLPNAVDYHESSIDGADDIDQTGHDLVVVNGSDPMRRRQIGAQAAFGTRFVCATVTPDTTDETWAAMVREATITGQGIIVEADSSLPEIGRRWIQRATHLAWVVSAPSGPPVAEMPTRPWHAVTAAATPPSDAEWAAAFGADTPRTHRLSYDQMHRVTKSLQSSGGDIDAAVRRLASGRLEQLTRRIQPTRGWDDIILSPDRMDALRAIVTRYQMATRVFDEWGFSATPSRGLVALFSGPSGTGKTLASEIIAGELGLDVFKLDLSSVVSKYIGETEKNLEQIFDAASAANMVLFFDEADSLFGKRSEVKDARDRYANIEVSYLLQRLETYDGLVVMATNFEKNVDEAFLRRIHSRVAFALPGPVERAAIWRQNLPPGAPADDVDVDWLAEQFELSGGTIRNASVQAAFTAAGEGGVITMSAAVRGVASELRKMGRLLRPEDFGEHFDLLDT
jgi:AAA+ superfamily predicted ATPase